MKKKDIDYLVSYHAVKRAVERRGFRGRDIEQERIQAQSLLSSCCVGGTFNIWNTDESIWNADESIWELS